MAGTSQTTSYDSLGTTTRNLQKKANSSATSLAKRLTELKTKGKLKKGKVKVKTKISVAVK